MHLSILVIGEFLLFLGNVLLGVILIDGAGSI